MAARQRFDAFACRVHAQRIDRDRGTYALVVINRNIDDRLGALVRDRLAVYVRVCTDADGVQYAIVDLGRQRKAGALRKQLALPLRARGADYEIGFSSDFKRTARLAGFPARREWGAPRIDGRSRARNVRGCRRPGPGLSASDGSATSGGTATDGQPWRPHHDAHDPFMGHPAPEDEHRDADAAEDENSNTEAAEGAHSDAMDSPQWTWGHGHHDPPASASEAAASLDEAEEDAAGSAGAVAYDAPIAAALTADPPCDLCLSAHDPLMGALAADAAEADAAGVVARNADSTDGFEFVAVACLRWPACGPGALDPGERLSPLRPWLYAVPEILLSGTRLESRAGRYLYLLD